MKLSSFEAIVRALNEARVHFIVVGGVAVNAHGYLRFTKDVDLVVRLVAADITGTFRALASLGYQPIVPINAEQFADPVQREIWRREKGMLVLKFWSDIHLETPVDLFVYEPFDFETEYARAVVGDGPADPPARFLALPALIAMKESAGRGSDRIDAEKLRIIAGLEKP
ncbi:MAG TPA: hypothetical protein VK178_05315 [Opitutaceae bacterium]|nr:hypothetical protein [Opitutaceae bacterium]